MLERSSASCKVLRQRRQRGRARRPRRPERVNVCVCGQGVHEANGARPPSRKSCRQEPTAPSRAFVDAILDWSQVTPFVGRRFAVALRSAVVGAVSGTLVRLSSPPRCPSFLLYSAIVTLSCPCLPSPPSSPRTLTPKGLAPPLRLCFGPIAFCFRRDSSATGWLAVTAFVATRFNDAFLPARLWRAAGAAGGPGTAPAAETIPLFVQ